MTPCFIKAGRAHPGRICRPITLRSQFLRAALAGAALFFAASHNLAAKPKWDPVNPADLAAKDSATIHGVDAEILFSRHTLDNNDRDVTTRNYVRAKIYTQKGVEEQGKLTIERWSDSRLDGLAARVVKVDGTTIDLKKADFLETTVVKYTDIKLKQTAFAFPDLAPGDIVEFQWEERGSVWAVLYHYYWYFCQEKLPVKEFKFAVESYPLDYEVFWFNCSGAELKAIDSRRMTLTVRNLPPFEEEAEMPPQRDFRAWLMIIANNRDYKAEEQWERISDYWSDEFRDDTRPSHAVRATATKLVAGAANDTEKLRRLYEYCRNEIVNFAWNDSPELRDAKKKRTERDDEQSPNETLTKRRGAEIDIDYLFASLSRAAGFEVKWARNASRTDLLNIHMAKGWNFLQNKLIAVKVDGRWRFYEPARYWVPFGMLSWKDEGATALLCDPDKVIYQDVPISPAEMSQSRRKGRFTLDAGGTLEGDVELTMTGHVAVKLKSEYWEKAADEIDRSFREDINKTLPTAEVSDIHWENLRTLDFPLTVRYKVRVPGYAEQAGKRLILSPGYFSVGQPARLTAEKRVFPIFFSHAWAEHDDIEIVLPEGFKMEQASAPADVGNPEGVLGATYQMAYKPKHRIVIYHRDFALGGNQGIAFRLESYAALKRLFEAIYKSDTHSVMLRQTVSVPETLPEAGAPHPQTVSATAAP